MENRKMTDQFHKNARKNLDEFINEKGKILTPKKTEYIYDIKDRKVRVDTYVWGGKKIEMRSFQDVNLNSSSSLMRWDQKRRGK